MVVRRCSACRTLWGEHREIRTGKYWDDSYLPEPFVRALRARREAQAAAIAQLLRSEGAAGPVLDYGCGQGVMLARLLAEGVDAWGCDLDPDAPLSAVDPARFVPIERPWQVPDGDWRTIVMLDVLEHHPDPIGFLRSLPGDRLLLKVPTATGPAAATARAMCRIGRAERLEQLFLHGETAPHRWLATREGLRRIAAAGGWERRRRRGLVEVGSELPDRVRPPVTAALPRTALRLIGGATGLVGGAWSDTEVAYFERSGSPA